MTNPADASVGTADGQPHHDAEPPAQIPPDQVAHHEAAAEPHESHEHEHERHALVPMNPAPQPSPPTRLLAADDPNVLEHLRMIQGIINRLATNSASAKTWCIAVVTATIALAGSAHVPGLAIMAFFAVAVFAAVDAMYLAQERRYRTLFNAKAGLVRGEGLPADQLYDLDSGAITIFEMGSAIESWSIWPIYLALLALCLIVAFIFSVTGPVR